MAPATSLKILSHTCFCRQPILKSLARKITYRLFDTSIFKGALQKQTILPLKEQVHWSGDCELNEPFPNVDTREALAAAESSKELIGKDLKLGLPLRVI